MHGKVKNEDESRFFEGDLGIFVKIFKYAKIHF